MYGYVVPKKDYLKTQDFVLYRAFYCGLCKATGKLYGQLPRLTTNYDMVFLSVLMHDCLAQDVSFHTSGCILNPFKKKTTVCRNALFDRIVATNILLSYYKVKDDIADRDGSGKRIAKALLTRAYKRASKAEPKMESIIKARFEELLSLEGAGESGIDRVAHCFASLLLEIGSELLGDAADENILKLCYNVGKFVYLADALDDIDDDHRKKRYNPFLISIGGYQNRQQFISDNQSEISFALSVTVNRAIECFNNSSFTQSYDLLKNILHIGLRDKCDQLLSSTKKLARPRI